jgi:hypothetical protein
LGVQIGGPKWGSQVIPKSFKAFPIEHFKGNVMYFILGDKYGFRVTLLPTSCRCR